MARNEAELDPDRWEIYRKLHAATEPHAPVDPDLDDYQLGLVDQAKLWATPLRPPRRVLAETTLPAVELGVSELFRPFGTPDLLYEYDDVEGIEQEILDYKFGPYQPLETHISAQMGGLATMALAASEALEVHCRVYHVPTKTEWSRSYSRADLPGLKTWYQKIIDDCLVPKPALTSGPWCIWCPGRGRCPAMRVEMNIVASAYSRDLAMTPRDRGELLSKARRVKAMVEYLEIDAKRLLSEDPAAIEGWKLLHVKPRRLRDARKVFNRITRRARIPAKHAWECLSVVKAKVKLLLRDTYDMVVGDLEAESEDESHRLVKDREYFDTQ